MTIDQIRKQNINEKLFLLIVENYLEDNPFPGPMDAGAAVTQITSLHKTLLEEYGKSCLPVDEGPTELPSGIDLKFV